MSTRVKCEAHIPKSYKVEFKRAVSWGKNVYKADSVKMSLGQDED